MLLCAGLRLHQGVIRWVRCRQRGSAVCRNGCFGQGSLARPAPPLGRGCLGVNGIERCINRHFNLRCRFVLSASTDRRRQDRRIEAYRWRSFGFARCAAIAAWTKPAWSAIVAYKRVLIGVAHRLAFGGTDHFNWRALRRSGFISRAAIFSRLAWFPGLARGAQIALLARFGSGALAGFAACTAVAITLAGFAVAVTSIAAGIAIGITRHIALLLARLISLLLAGGIAFIAAALAIKSGEICIHAIFHRIVFGFALAPPIARRPTVRARAMVLRANAAVGDHAKVMIGELKIVFGLNPVAVKVRILRLFAILFEHLGRIAPRAAIDPVELLATATLRTIIGPAAAAVVIITTIVVQVRHILARGGLSGTSKIPCGRAILYPVHAVRDAVVPSICVSSARLTDHHCKWWIWPGREDFIRHPCLASR
jgi:hypothetical protein